MIENVFNEINGVGVGGDGSNCHSDGYYNGCCCIPMNNYYYWAGMSYNSEALPFGEFNY